MVGSAVEKVSVPVRASLENAGMLAIQLYAKTTMALWGESSLKGRKILKGEKKKMQISWTWEVVYQGVCECVCV